MNKTIEDLAIKAGVLGISGIEHFAALVVSEAILAIKNADTKHAFTTWDRDQAEATLEKAEKSVKETFNSNT